MQLGMRNRWNVNAESARWMRMLLDAVRRVDKRFAEAEVGALVVLIRVGVAVGLFACDPAVINTSMVSTIRTTTGINA